jgi:hypothetical protein
MRLVISAENSVDSVAGSSPAPGSLMWLASSENSSMTKGSSIASVVGKKRLPAKPCGQAAGGTSNKAAIAHPILKTFLQLLRSLPFIFASLIERPHTGYHSNA